MKDDTTGRVLRLELLIDGMVAVHAKQALYTALAGVEGVRGAVVELGRAEVELEPRPDANARLADAVALAGCSLREVRVLPRSLPTL